MQKITLLFLLSAAFAALHGQDVMITGIFDGTATPGQYPKGVELYVLNDVPDLSVLQLSSANNGAAAPNPPESQLTGSAQAGDYLYLTNDGPDFQSFFGFGANQVVFAMNVNGNDAVLLYQNGTLIDCYGQVGVDGTGQGWEYTDGWSKRNHTNGPNVVFDLTEWQTAMNHLNGCATNLTCTGTNQHPFPLSVVLPVALTSFAGTPTKVGTELAWTTAHELNNDYFDIERSPNAKNWQPVGYAIGNGTTEAEQHYEFLDRNAPAGTSYYRLRQVDYDGAVNYYGPLAVRTSAKETIRVYPNPVAEVLNVRVGTPATVVVTDPIGREVLSHVVEVAGTVPLPTTGWRAGVYAVTVRSSSGTQTARVVKN